MIHDQHIFGHPTAFRSKIGLASQISGAIAFVPSTDRNSHKPKDFDPLASVNLLSSTHPEVEDHGGAAASPIQQARTTVLDIRRYIG
jgi:hypothetical protein